MDTQTLITLAVTVGSVLFNLVAIVWKVAGVEKDLSTRLTVLETEMRFITGNNKREHDPKR